ncbi:hypothetical protein Musp01_25200 [Muricauda sp. NBRC 101325]|nr:hypothetical protein Musp01_25200 [Muricauda sp. NBRC 101325]
MLFIFSSLVLLSCSKDSDLFDETVQSQIEEEVSEEGEVINSISFSLKNDEFTISGELESVVLDVLQNDSIPEKNVDSYRIIEVTEALEGTVSLNDDNTITYSPNSDSADKNGNNGVVRDNFSYKLEVMKNGKRDSKEATVIVNTDYSTLDMGNLKAFPSAEGYGKNTIGGRGGEIIHVTNLNEDGPGSLVAAMKASGPRIVVFDVGGTIEWTKEQYIINPNITIAGETAPSPGITITGNTLGIRASEVIVRFLRIRIGDDATPDNNIDGIRIINTTSGTIMKNIIVDHCDISLASDENLSFQGNALGASNASLQNVTVQNCMISDPLGEYDYAILIGENLANLSILRNGLFNIGNRGPEHTYGDGSTGLEFVNNIIYNYNRPVTISFGDSEFDSVGNVFKGDSDYPPSQADHHYQLNNYENPSGLVSDGKVHQSDNIQIGYSSYNMMNDNWSRVNQANRVAASDYTPLSSAQVVDEILYDLGASILFPDTIASMRLAEFTNSSGKRKYSSIIDAGGIPTLSRTFRSETYDSDRDGMADAWEIGRFGDLSQTANGDANDDGYTNIEEFFHSLIN